MPYIPVRTRVALDSRMLQPTTAGELNYKITKLILAYIDKSGPYARYARYNEVIGVLECAKLELYRRRVAPYEDEKKEENGDVYAPREN